MKKTVGVYIITNTVNGKVYIGQSHDIFARWRTHKYFSKNGDTYLYNAMKKYGIEKFTFNVLHECNSGCSQFELDALEIMYIETYKSMDRTKGYNIKSGGSKGIQSSETKEKLRLLAIGRKASESTKLKMSNSRKGKKFSEEHKNNLLKSKIGRKHSEETRKRLSLMKIGSKASEETRKAMSLSSHNSKPIINITTGAEYRSVCDAAKSCNSVGVYGIADCANGKRKEAKGYSWAWKEDVTNA